MKRNVIFLCAFAAIAIILSGCGDGDGNGTPTDKPGGGGNGTPTDKPDGGGATAGGGGAMTGDAEIDKMLDEMGFEKAPELGELSRKFFVAMYNCDADFIWDNITEGSKDNFKKQLDDIKKRYEDKDINEAIKEAQANLDKTPEAQQGYLKLALDGMKADKEAIDKDSPKVMLERMIKMIFKDKEKAKKEMMKEKIKVIGEDFSEGKKTGWLKMEDEDGEEEKGFVLTKEDGAWKIDFDK